MMNDLEHWDCMQLGTLKADIDPHRPTIHVHTPDKQTHMFTLQLIASHRTTKSGTDAMLYSAADL